MRSLFLALVVGAAILVVSCGGNKGTSDSSNAAVRNATPPDNSSSPVSGSNPHAASPASLNYTTASKENLPQVSGPIIVEHQIEVMSQRDGIVAKIFVDTGTRVKAGQLLAKLDDRQITANLEAARAKSRGIEADLKNWHSEVQVLKADCPRGQNLWDLGLTSEEQLQHAKYKAESDQWDIKRVEESLNTARQEEKSLELELEKAKIIAPFGGLIARRYVREGQSVAKGDRVFWLTAEGPLLVRFTLPEKLFGHVRPGQGV